MQTEGSDKLKSLLTESDRVNKIKDKYEEIYKDSTVWLYKKSHGVHSVVFGILKNDLAGKRYLDVGCGAGRLAIMCSHLSKEAAGFDFSETAINIAVMNAACCGQDVDFSVSDIEGFCRKTTHTYDVITMIGVLEHVSDPLATLQMISTLTASGGIVVVSCPNFINPRGFSYMTLLTLFRFPMSLADLWQIDYMHMEEWCSQTDFAVTGHVGAIYRFGWDHKSVADMTQRVPKAVKDIHLDVALDYKAYNEWQERTVRPNHEVLEWLAAQGVIKRIEPGVELRMERKVPIADKLWDDMSQYMREDIMSDPYYCDVAPFSHMGGECIYILKKTR
jgi:2-polyprenyl-3-methyl-5-hydroxy-6-metoxy-1,4-benzoquinol methylase